VICYYRYDYYNFSLILVTDMYMIKIFLLIIFITITINVALKRTKITFFVRWILTTTGMTHITHFSRRYAIATPWIPEAARLRGLLKTRSLLSRQAERAESSNYLSVALRLNGERIHLSQEKLALTGKEYCERWRYNLRYYFIRLIPSARNYGRSSP